MVYYEMCLIPRYSFSCIVNIEMLLLKIKIHSMDYHEMRIILYYNALQYHNNISRTIFITLHLEFLGYIIVNERCKTCIQLHSL